MASLPQETESLVRRLAGPSSGKAGLATDQTKINRIISDASKGSKFYENEKKKDKELTARIEKILKHRDEGLSGIDVAKVEAIADHLIEQIEEKRDLTQIIVHVDMDAFFANVELLDNPNLDGKAFAVVGKGILTTASYEARKFGVRSGMAGFIAKKLCPHLIFVPNRHWRYSEMSDQIMDIFSRYDPDMCPAGCDEGYLNITPYCEEHSMTAEECVKEMRETVFRQTKLTVSAGIAPNKMLAKICSDKNKPNGQYQLDFNAESIKSFMRDLSIRKVPGIGRVNERLLEAIGIKASTCGDIYAQRAVVSLMDKQFGTMFLFRTHLGIASNIVEAHRREERKSIGAERTFSTLHKLEDILAKLDEVAAELEKDMEDTGWMGRTITLKYKLDTYQGKQPLCVFLRIWTIERFFLVFTRAKSMSQWISKKEDLFNIGKELLLAEFPLRLRLIGLRVTKLKDLRDTGSSGIKRFFESAKGDSPRKRQKVEIYEDAHDAMEENMPGYYEHDETDYKLKNGDNDNDDDVIDTIEDPDYEIILNSSRPPHSTVNPVSSTSKLETPVKRRNSDVTHSSTNAKSVNLPAQRPLETHECPICGKTLETDNEGLNAHVDFCLSRGAILEAQAEASKSGMSPKKFIGWTKPESIKKKETQQTATSGKRASRQRQ
ncbi:DNA/RNA polymerase [Pholiota conissans]|uniref:DNA polymerase kappa n=1 Tax=Pholiota conissans TaxID=109636 RepID=A0A9P5Z0Y3_9AGAR|nr:DNA/RNA polymerase [Pholiota conissans]